VVTEPSRIPLAPRRIDYVRLCDVPPAFRNPKKHSDPDINASIEEHGFADAAILDERTQRLVAGHGRTKALVDMKARGEQIPDGIMIDEDGEWLVPIQRGWSSKSDAHAEAFIILHNQLVVAGGWDDRLLAEMLHDVHAADAALFDGIGFGADELDDLFRVYDPDRDGLDDDTEPARVDDDEDDLLGDDTPTPAKDRIVMCPNCYHEFIPGKDD
jgi:hypothetical protein